MDVKEKENMTIQEKEQELLRPQLQRIHFEEMKFGSFWVENRVAISLIVAAVAFLMSMVPYLQVP